MFTLTQLSDVSLPSWLCPIPSSCRSASRYETCHQKQYCQKRCCDLHFELSYDYAFISPAALSCQRQRMTHGQCAAMFDLFLFASFFSLCDQDARRQFSVSEPPARIPRIPSCRSHPYKRGMLPLYLSSIARISWLISVWSLTSHQFSPLWLAPCRAISRPV
jgi:hypothetical protein